IISSKRVDEYKIIRLKIENKKDTIIDIISKDDYEINTRNVSLNIINDRKILEIATFSNRYYDKKIEFISMDIMARTRAISLDIKTSSLIGK
ncbi:PIN domain-containing protein, partial [Aliarcobacter butzleri]